MSEGPTGVRGPQGPNGTTGANGLQGIIGQVGKQGPIGPIGPTGPTGLSGSTGIKLFGNGTLVQCASIFTSQAILGGSYITLNNFTPQLDSDLLSTTINGQYDTSGLNYYGSPLSINTTQIHIPAGKYFISAVLPMLASNVGNPILRLYETGEDGVSLPIDTATIAASDNSDCHLQHYFTPSVDTVISLYIESSPTALTPVIDPEHPTLSLSIVKIW